MEYNTELRNFYSFQFIDHIYDISRNVQKFPAHIDEAIVLIGVHHSPIHRVARDAFKDYAFPEHPKKGFKGTYAYLVLAKYQGAVKSTKKEAFVFNTEFFKYQLDLNMLVERAEKLKVVVLITPEVLMNADKSMVFEYLHKEVLSFLTLADYNDQDIGLVIMSKNSEDVNVHQLLAEQAYQSPLLSVLASNHLFLTGSTIAGRAKDLKHLLGSLNGRTSSLRVSKRFYNHKHYVNIDNFILDFNDRLMRLSHIMTDEILSGFEYGQNASLVDLDKAFTRFVDVVLNIEYANKRPTNLVATFTSKGLAIPDLEKQFASNLDDHLDLLDGGERISNAANAQYRIKDMEFLEGSSLKDKFDDPNQYAVFLQIVTHLKYDIRLACALLKLEKPFRTRQDTPSKDIYKSLVQALGIQVSELGTYIGLFKNVRHSFSESEFAIMVDITLDMYREEMSFIFGHKFDATKKLVVPLPVFQLDFDARFEDIKTKLINVTHLTVSDSVNETLHKVAPQLNIRHKPIDRTLVNIMKSLRELKETLKTLQPMRKDDFEFMDFLKFLMDLNTSGLDEELVDLESLQSLTMNTTNLTRAYHAKYVSTDVVDGKQMADREFKLRINEIFQSFKSKTLNRIVKFLCVYQSKVLDRTVEKFDAYLNGQLRELYADYQLDDPNDWKMWRQQTKQPFERLHLLQDVPHSIEQFVRGVQLYSDNHYIEMPKAIMDEMLAVQAEFEAVDREMRDDIQTAINTKFIWGKRIKLSHSYLLNSAASQPSFINSMVNWVTGPSRQQAQSVSELGPQLLFISYIVMMFKKAWFK